MKKIILLSVLVLCVAIIVFGCDDDREYQPSDSLVITNIGIWCKTPSDIDGLLDRCPIDVKLPCGCGIIYQTTADIPRETTECEHNNYFVKIGD